MGSRVFQCYRCTHCCFFVHEFECPTVFDDERLKLNELAKKLGISLEFKQISRGIWRFVIRGFCPFYDIRNRKCLIHEEKPLACKMFPLLVNPKNGVLMVSRACEWVNENWSEVISRNVSEVFPNEFRIAIEVFIRFREFSGK